MTNWPWRGKFSPLKKVCFFGPLYIYKYICINHRGGGLRELSWHLTSQMAKHQLVKWISLLENSHTFQIPWKNLTFCWSDLRFFAFGNFSSYSKGYHSKLIGIFSLSYTKKFQQSSSLSKLLHWFGHMPKKDTQLLCFFFFCFLFFRLPCLLVFSLFYMQDSTRGWRMSVSTTVGFLWGHPSNNLGTEGVHTATIRHWGTDTLSQQESIRKKNVFALHACKPFVNPYKSQCRRTGLSEFWSGLNPFMQVPR